jgi:hypothetical protein
MPVIDRFRFVGKDMGQLTLLYPRVKVIRDPYFYSFIPWKRIIVVSEEKPFRRYPDKEVIQITSDAPIALDTRKGFLGVLPRYGVKATSYQLRLLLEDMSDEEFWYHAKQSLLLKGFPAIPLEGGRYRRSTVLDLFDSLFVDFGAVYRHYQDLRRDRSANHILQALLDMTAKARELHKHSVHPFVRSVLKKNRKYLPLWLAALDKFLRAGRSDDQALLGLFATCSSHTRPESWPPYFTEVDMVGFHLRRWGYDPNSAEIKALFPGVIM